MMSASRPIEPWIVEEIIDAIPGAFLAFDRDLRLIHFNRHVVEFTGLPLGSMIGRTLWEIFPKARGAETGSRIEEAIASGTSHSFEAASATRPDRYIKAHVVPSSGGVVIYFTDITEQKEFEQRSRELASRLNLMINAAPLLISYIDREFRYLFVNRTYEEWFNRSTGEIAGSPIWEIIGEEAFQRAREPLTVALSGEKLTHEFSGTPPDGITRHVRSSYIPDIDADGTVRGVIIISEDITSRKQAETALYESERLARFLLSFGDTIRPLTDPSEIVATSARLLGEHLGADRCAYAEMEEDEDHFLLTGDYTVPGVVSIIGRYSLSGFGPDTLRAMQGGRPFVADDVEVRLAGDEEHLANYRATAIRSIICAPLHKKGKLVAGMAVHMISPRHWTSEEIELVRLITDRCWESIERARVLRSLRASESRFRLMADSAPVLIWIADTSRRFTWFNKPWLEFTGRKMEEETGVGWTDGIHPDDSRYAIDTYMAAFTGREEFTMEYRLLHRSGEYRWVMDKGVPMFDEWGTFTGYVGSCVDIHGRKVAEQEREDLLGAERAARTESERANRVKDEFLSILSHELRTPLNAMLGWSEMMRSGELSQDDMQTGLEVINRNVRAQTQIVDDLLDMSRIISGKIRLSVQRTDVAEIIDVALESIRPAANAKQIQLTKVIDSIASPIMGDPSRLQQIIWNLLTNAVKFTPNRGRVQVVMKRTESHIEVSVADTGEGIAPADLPHIFERFRQVDSSTTRKHGGLGIGLAIVKSLAELHGGVLHASSPGLGQGATFTLRLPVAATITEADDEPVIVKPSLSGPAEPVSLSGTRILAIDDDADSRDVIRRVLEAAGATVFAASGAAEALILLNGERPDLIICDIGMPGMDGYQFIREVRRRSPGEGGKMPAIALTAFARSQDRRQAFIAGFQAHVAKPVEPGELVALVASLAAG